jgi:chromosome segregation ATPase
MRTVEPEWKTEVASTRAQLQQDRATLEGARSWQSQAEEKAKEAEQLRVELAKRATALATAEGQLQQEQSARQQAEAGLFSRSDPLSRRPELPSSVNAWRWRRHMANSSGSVLRSRRREPPSSSGTGKSRGLTGS